MSLRSHYQNLLVKEGKKKEKTDNPVKNLLILRMFFRLSLRISAEALKINEFSDNSRKIGSRKIAAGCLDFFYVHTRAKRKIYHAHYAYRNSYYKFLYV